MKHTWVLAGTLFVVVYTATYFLLAPSSMSQRIRECALQCSFEQCKKGVARSDNCITLCSGTHDTLSKQKLGECRSARRWLTRGESKEKTEKERRVVRF